MELDLAIEVAAEEADLAIQVLSFNCGVDARDSLNTKGRLLYEKIRRTGDYLLLRGARGEPDPSVLIDMKEAGIPGLTRHWNDGTRHDG